MYECLINKYDFKNKMIFLKKIINHFTVSFYSRVNYKKNIFFFIKENDICCDNVKNFHVVIQLDMHGKFCNLKKKNLNVILILIAIFN